MKLPDDKSIETLLRGTIRQPSARFEEALGQIPHREDIRKTRSWTGTLRLLAIAATLLLSLGLFMKKHLNSLDTEVLESVPAITLDEEWMAILSLAESVEIAQGLADEETRFTLDYYAFNQ